MIANAAKLVFVHLLGLIVTNDGTYSDFKSSSNQIQVNAKELLIPVAGVDDAGVYICNATNNMGSVSASAYLGVTGAKFLYILSQLKFRFSKKSRFFKKFHFKKI